MSRYAYHRIKIENFKVIIAAHTYDLRVEDDVLTLKIINNDIGLHPEDAWLIRMITDDILVHRKRSYQRMLSRGDQNAG